MKRWKRTKKVYILANKDGEIAGIYTSLKKAIDHAHPPYNDIACFTLNKELLDV